MKPIGISFTPPMYRQAEAGLKTQTRRPTVPLWDPLQERAMAPNCGIYRAADGVSEVRSPYGTTGQILYVREKHRITNFGTRDGDTGYWATVEFAAGDLGPAGFNISAETYHKLRRSKTIGRWRSPRFMYREFARLWLRVTEPVRVERLNEISIEDARAEGVPETWGDGGNILFPADKPHEYDNRTTVENFQKLWESIYGPGSREANPYVWRVAFEKTEKPENL